MKVTIEPEWTLIRAIEAAFDAYQGFGKTSRGYRISVVLAWANVVGRQRATAELNALKTDAGSWRELAETFGVAESTLNRVRRRFAGMPELTPFSQAPSEADASVLESIEWAAQIGRGGSGEVWRGTDALNRTVAAKFINSSEREPLQRILDHARPLAALGRHANIVAVYWCGLVRHPTSGIQAPALVMELVPGVSLREAMRAGLRAEQAIGFLRDICSAIAFIHSRRLVHGDLHTDNILCTPEGRAVLIDLINERRSSSVTSGFIRRGWTDDVEALKAIIAEVLRSANLDRLAATWGSTAPGLSDAVAVHQAFLALTNDRASERIGALNLVDFLHDWQRLEERLQSLAPTKSSWSPWGPDLTRVPGVTKDLQENIHRMRHKRNRLVHMREREVTAQELAEIRAVVTRVDELASRLRD